ncbi:MAG: hypothetical protein HY547_06100 [Elusimicrobia bacterium]|nr:hypothetical protein [Elusimicrobiota bacterium]
MKNSNSDHQRNHRIKNVVISGFMSLTILSGSAFLFAENTLLGNPLVKIFDTLANDAAPGPVLCPPGFGKNCPRPGTDSGRAVTGGGPGSKLGDFHDERGAHQPGYGKVLAGEATADQERRQSVSPYGLEPSDCPDGLCNQAAVSQVKAANGETIEVKMADIVNDLHTINVYLDSQPEADIVHVSAGSFEGHVRRLETRYAQATAGDEAQQAIAASDLLKAIDVRCGTELRGYAFRVDRETGSGRRRGLR